MYSYSKDQDCRFSHNYEFTHVCVLGPRVPGLYKGPGDRRTRVPGLYKGPGDRGTRVPGRYKGPGDRGTRVLKYQDYIGGQGTGVPGSKNHKQLISPKTIC